MNNNENIALAAERELIDVIVSNRSTEDDLSEVFSLLESKHFLSPQCALAYRVCQEAYMVEGSISKGAIIAILANEISPYKSAVIDMLNIAPPHTLATGFDITTLSKVIKEFSYRRDIESLPTIFTDDDNSVTMSTKVMDLITKISEDQESNSRVEATETFDDFLEEVSSGKQPDVIPLGFKPLDDKLGGGLRAGEFVIVAARPGQGKTTLAFNFSSNIAFGIGGRVLFFSLEMSRKEIIGKLMSSEANVQHNLIRENKIKKGSDEWIRINDAAERMRDSGGEILINDNPGMTAAAILASAKSEMLRGPIDLIVIDYIQLMKSPENSSASRQEIVSEISRSLKLIAKTLEVPLIGISQLNRNLIGRDGKSRQPAISDLRESGSLEQDADVIMLIGSANENNDDDEESFKENVSVPLILAKQRAGETGEIRLSPLLAYSQFVPVYDEGEAVPDFVSNTFSTENEVGFDSYQKNKGGDLPW